eukprot:CAMPEP_0172683270 /NCGR_PEP_ID=MMETSP1074-20121228/18740_1 /TAXON_ID=2916 /ORGANISM="Ceratium fusus, Strain PA161109" /LENGTH=930 /DNA_ID=CAMNT_0013502099 /DNA_START=181 /DNA_END=2973 /DNA_ORIENTATION=+
MVFLVGQMVDYTAKLLLLVCLWREPTLRIHFAALAAVHVAANMHGAYVLCRSAPIAASGMLSVAAFFLGAATPVAQAAHFLDSGRAWWAAQDVNKRRPMRSAPVDVVVEGLAFACAALHLRICLILGRLEAPIGLPEKMPLTFEALLTLTMATSLLTTATGLVIFDSTVSIKLSRDMFGWPSRGGARRGTCGRGGVFLSHLIFRSCEVAGKAALLAALAAVLGPGRAAGYVACTYVATWNMLFMASYREVATVRDLGDAAVLAWPLMFANLPQFVDSPKHVAAANSVASVVAGWRALELAVALSTAIAAFLLEDDMDKIVSGCTEACPDVVLAAHAWKTLCWRSTALGWCLCFLVQYLHMTMWWCCSSRPMPPAAVAAAGGGLHAGHGSLGRREVPMAPWMHPPRQHEGEAQDFWPPVVSLVQLLLVAASERVPACFFSPTTASLSASGTSTKQQLRVEDFDKIHLLGSGEFGKVFQVKHRQTQEVFAMKKLSKDFYMQRRMTDKALREIAMLSHAHGHPFIVKLVYAIENSTEWALVMEYCPRGDLHHLLLMEGLPGLALNRAMQITAEVALALEHLHSLGIVFRDLKLENVVLDHKGRSKLTDFGLAKQRRGGHNAIAEAEQCGGSYASFTTTYCGSHGYAAPEINPRLVHGFAADLYSFGVLLLMLLMGGEVFHDAQSERRLPPETPNDLREVLGRLSFDFYWASHHFLQPARAAHRVEVNLNGSMVVMSRGPRGVRRQTRPRRPPNSPRVQSPDRDYEGGRPTHPAKFPALACATSEAEERHWDLALDLIRTLTKEFPGQRGTVASVKRHAFFSAEIRDWRLVYPKTWLIGNLKEKIAAQGRELSRPVLERLLEQSSSEELVSMLDDPTFSVAGLIRQISRPATPPSGPAAKVAARPWAPTLGPLAAHTRTAVPPDRNAPWVEQYP